MDQQTLIRFIKEIGRGRSAGDLSRDDAQALFTAMLDGDIPDLQLGAVLIALRVKGESLDELAGFASACEASYSHLERSAAGTVPVVVPAYNGARQLPNLVPLLALTLARQGIPVLIHGVKADPGRITTCEVLNALGITAATSSAEAQRHIEAMNMTFVPINVLAPEVASMLALRRKLGVRNSAHTLVKMLQPFTGDAVRIVSVTHPDYLIRMRAHFTAHDNAALLLRGAEGEAVAHPRREPYLEWAFRGAAETWKTGPMEAPLAPSDLPDRSAEATARWIEQVLAGETPMPQAIAHQVACCQRAVAAVAAARSDA